MAQSPGKLSLKIVQASLNQTAMDFPRNLLNIYDAISSAVEQGADILALEELALTGYDCGDDFEKTDNDLIEAHLNDIAAYAAALDPNLIISIGHPWRLTKRDVRVQDVAYMAERQKNTLFNRLNLPFNVQSLITGGQIQSMTAKMYLYNDERGYEKRYFQEWSMQDADKAGGFRGTITTTLSDGRTIPFGRPIVHFRNDEDSQRINIAHVICEEKWVASQWGGGDSTEFLYGEDNVPASYSWRLGSPYAGQTDGLVLLIPNASPPAPLKMDKHNRLNLLASNYADVIVDTDGLGSSGSTFAQFGHRSVVKSGGLLLSSGNRLSFKRVATTTTTVRVNNAAAAFGKEDAILSHNFNSAAAPESGHITYLVDAQHAWDSPANTDRDKEEIVRMTALWLFDYMRKTKPQGFAQAQSGGADSAFNSTIVAAMVRLGMSELGVTGFCRELSHLKYIDKIMESEKAGGMEAAYEICMHNMLTSVYLGTNNSSWNTENAAQFLIDGGTLTNGTMARGIGGKFLKRNVQDLLNFYAAVFALENTSSLQPQRKQELMATLSTHLNRNLESITLDQLAQEACEIKARFPEIQDLVSTANPRDIVAYENIQARARQVVIMMIANIEGKMAIANPNLDEARNAYATYGGDLHSGTVNLNGHINKAYQLEVMDYLCRKGLQGAMPPVLSLTPTLKNKPSAELLPKDANGNVVQNDEDALQRTFPQMNLLSRLMLLERLATKDGSKRLMNVSEVYALAQAHPYFAGVSEDRLYNMVRLTYERWAISQHKIHATPITPTFGSNVDHQVSRRTPNLSGNCRDELTLLGVNLLLERARRESVIISGTNELFLRKRARQDEDFVAEFEAKIRGKSDKELKFNLDKLYQQLKAKGWDGVFTALPHTHPLRVICRGPA